MTPRGLREIWRDRIGVEDYERHMAAAGQAQASAWLLEELLREHGPGRGARLWFAGAGTGQCFDYTACALLDGYEVTFTDINAVYLQRLAERLREIDFSAVVDDIEAPEVAGPFDLAIVVLVFEHVDWRRAVAALAGLCRRVFVVVQQNPAEPPPDRLRDTMALLRECPPSLVDVAELTAAFAGHGFGETRRSARAVADGKVLLGLDLVRASADSA